MRSLLRLGVRVALVVTLAGTAACSGGSGEDVAVSASGAGEADVDGAAPATKDDRQVAPEFELKDLQGQPVTMSSLRGKTVVIDFWATWCPPCIFQIPILNSVQARHAASGVVVLGVSVDAEGIEVVKPYAEENGIQYTVLLGNESLARKFGAPGFPAMAIVAPDGRIDSMHVGLIEEADLDAAIADIVGGQG